MTPDCPSDSDEARTIRADASRLSREIPPLASLLDGFAPLLAGQAALKAEAPGWIGDAPGFDPELFCKGKPLLAETGFQDVTPDIPLAAKRLLPVMARCFPGLGAEIDALARAMSADPGRTAAALADAPRTGDVEALAGVSPETAAFVGQELIRPLIHRQAETLSPMITDLPWRFPVCPTCGGRPGFSWFRKFRDEAEYITGHGGPRYLRCGGCGTWWRYKRVSCPGCGNEEPSKLSFLRSPERPYERADVCAACNRYLLCLDTTELIHIPHPDVAALAMLPLELLARDRGYRPFAGGSWSATADGPDAPLGMIFRSKAAME